MKDKAAILHMIEELKTLDTQDMYLNDFFHTWKETDDEIKAVFEIADILRAMREDNISPKVFDSGLGISIFRDNSTRTRFSFASACNLLGLAVQDLDEKKSQIAHGETVRETANMVSFMADVIGIRDDMYIGKGHAYQKAIADAVQEGYDNGVLEQRPTVVNLQCDIDHPTQCLADIMSVINFFGKAENLKGKKVAMTWAYSPSYGKPLSVPQGVVGLFTRFGMEVTLAYPDGYDIMPEVEDVAQKNVAKYGGSYRKVHTMQEAFRDADIVYPKSWAPLAVMQERTKLVEKNDGKALDELERQCLANNAKFKSWTCDENIMRTTHDGKALYLHCLPADITGVSCEHGEVDASVFDRYLTRLYKQASYKPYVIAAIIMLERFRNPARELSRVLERGGKRVF